jgi:uncharacterized repeat protein (TIGR03803 family)
MNFAVRCFDLACAGFILTVLIVLNGTVSAQTLTTLYSFGTFGANPMDVAAQGRDGQLYGATENGGQYALGTIFKINTAGNAALLHSFNGSDGSYPGGLTLGADGNFYGTTFEGGSFGFGVLFRMTPNGTLTVLHNFNMDGTDGYFPQSPPILASDGNYYGTTGNGGTDRVGTVYKLTPAGAYSVIYNLDPAIAMQAIGGPTQGSDGNLYITAWFQGTSVCGSIVKISTAGVLLNTYVLNCATDGSNPTGNLLQASDGNFFGTESFGGTYSLGVLFKLTPSFSYSVLHDFGSTQTEGDIPTGPVLQGTDGNLYGLDRNGGEFGYGTIYRCSLGGDCSTLDSWSSQVYAAPQLIQHTNGSFYGATWAGGLYNLGSFFGIRLGLKPFITLVLYRAKAGSTVQILGQGLSGATSVTFNGLAATSFKVLSDTYMTAVVPAGATNGTVVVTTPAQTLKSNKKFQVI